MLTIGITTYNRLEIIKKMAASLYASNLDIPYNIRVYDDASNEFSLDALHDVFPNASQIVRNEKNVKADKNIYLMYEDFLRSDDKYFFNADSDLIFSQNWMQEGMSLFKKSDGVLSLFNSYVTKVIGENDGLFLKEKVGTAGTLLTKEIVKEILQCISLSDLNETPPLFDYKWCAALRKKGKKICCVKNSLVQHIGLNGQNSSDFIFDYGYNFSVDNLLNGQILNDTLMNLATARKKNWYALFPFSKVPIHSRIVLYGYGSLGKDFLKQIRQSRYCELIAIVDKNYMDFAGEIKSPKVIRSLEFDYIVIAIKSSKIIHEVHRELVTMIPTLNKKIIWADERVLSV